MSEGNRILIIDDHPLFRKGVAQLIAMAPHLEVVGEVSNGEQGVAIAKALDPDLVLLDLHMTGMGGIETLRAIRDADLDCRVVILTVSDSADDLVAAIRSGADGYLLKDMEPEDLLTAIDEALNGRTVIGERLNGLLARAIREEATAKQRDTASLTDREKEILQGLAQGLANKLIARNLKITEATVKVHVKNLLKKLGFHSRLEAAVWAVGRNAKQGGGTHARGWPEELATAQRSGLAGKPQIRLGHSRVFRQFRGASLERDLAGFEHVTVVRDLQRGAGILLHQKNGDAGLAQVGDDVEDLAHDPRGQPETGLVQHQQPRLGHERAAERKHLPLAPGQRRRKLGVALLEARETRVHRLHICIQAALAAPDALERAQAQIVLDAEFAEQLAPLRHQAQPHGDARLHARAGKVGPGVTHAAAARQQPHDRAEQRRLSRAIGADHGHDRALSHLQRGAMQSFHLSVVDPEVAYLQHRAHSMPPR